MRPTVYRFRRGQPVPQWLEAVYVDGKLVQTDMQFDVDGKMVIVGPDVYLWPTKRYYRSIMRITKCTDNGEALRDAEIYGSGISGRGKVIMFGSVAGLRKACRTFKNSVHTKPLPKHFDRGAEVECREVLTSDLHMPEETKLETPSANRCPSHESEQE